MTRYTPEPLSEGFRVTADAPLADFSATSYRIPGCVGPLDSGMVAHASRPGLTDLLYNTPGPDALQTTNQANSPSAGGQRRNLSGGACVAAPARIRLRFRRLPLSRA